MFIYPPNMDSLNEHNKHYEHVTGLWITRAKLQDNTQYEGISPYYVCALLMLIGGRDNSWV
jgi:hypothetical protein